MTQIEFRILGPLQVISDGQPLPLPAAKLRVLLAVLLCNANQPVTQGDLFDALWDGDPPKTATKVLQVYVHQLRQLIGTARLIRHPHGYALTVEPSELDAFAFRALVAQAEQSADDTESRDLLAEADLLWRGPALADLADVAALREPIDLLTGQRLSALESRMDLELSLGRAADAATELIPVVRSHPLREGLRGQLMVALFRCGRRSEALQTYQEGREILDRELGVEPDEDLQRIQLAILNGSDPGAAVANPEQVTSNHPVPAQLPPATTHFTGRSAHLQQLDDLLDRARLAGGTLVVSAIAGMGGVGKTALALHWARLVSHRFPDGQLYANLNGYSPLPPVSAHQALERFLRALAVPVQDIPADVDAAASLFRTVLTGRQMLILLDNAADAEQVRPLLPASSGCMALVTSRSRMDGLVALDGATRLDLDRLTLPEALALLADLLGTVRVEAEPGAAASLAQACGYLPLALRIVAAHLAGRPRQKLAALLAELHDDRLGTLETADDPQMSVQAVLGRSYDGLNLAHRRAFRLLASIGWSTFPVEAAAAILGTDVAQAQAVIDVLTDVYLLQPQADGRYAFHDLVQAYARSAETDGDDDGQAQGRFLSYLRYLAALANSFMAPDQQEPSELDTPLTEPKLGTAQDAMAWLESETSNLIDSIVANAVARPEISRDIALRLWPFLNESGRTSESIMIFELLTQSTQTVDDKQVWSALYNALGGAYLKAGRYQESISIHRQCLEIREALGDERATARSHANLGLLFERLGQYDQSLAHYQKTLDISRRCGDRELELRIISGGITGVYFRLGKYEKTLDLLMSGLDSAREYDSPFVLCPLLVNLGETYRYLREPEKALTCLNEALTIARQLRLTGSVAHALAVTADVELDLGHAERAIALRLEANELIAETGLRGEQIDALLELANAYQAAEQERQAEATLNKGLALAIELGERHAEGRAHVAMGRLLRDTDPARAREHLTTGITILEAIQPGSAAEARALLPA